MKKMTATDLKQNLSQTLEAARDEPVTVEKSGRPYAVIMHPEEYRWYQTLEDRYWGAKAQAAWESGDYVDGIEALRELAIVAYDSNASMIGRTCDELRDTLIRETKRCQ